MLIATYRLVRVKEKTKAYTDKAKNTKQSDIHIGDQVLVKDKKTSSPQQQYCYRNSKWDPTLEKCFPFVEIWDR